MIFIIFAIVLAELSSFVYSSLRGDIVSYFSAIIQFKAELTSCLFSDRTSTSFFVNSAFFEILYDCLFTAPSIVDIDEPLNLSSKFLGILESSIFAVFIASHLLSRESPNNICASPESGISASICPAPFVK